MDYQEEQNNEIEALDSIYCGDMSIISSSPVHKFSIPIKSEEFDSETEDGGLMCNLVFTYTPKYPEEAPEIEVEDTVNFENDFESGLIEHLKEQVTENLGMVMVFTLVSTAQEWLNVKWDEHKKYVEEEKYRKEKEEEEAERQRFEGTRVTVETFMKWKMQFEIEMGIAKKRETVEKDSKKLTGRELFLQDITLNESDLKFLDEGDSVKVDESLFQDLDDLELDEIDSGEDSDEDYVPSDEVSD
ncbi:PREDICTED: RWD domain-containing protein 1 [Nicrophorus vespilloides]|uniref:RWD domain-containing protein 1 n=1 Tax=Nicrophorus vespilloides TaxID=110193 RepID=A0ABM1NKF3_NICVS|nr:PREDICTED: RWD domain-containing protein 1 [Nicrophorus vespilloides]